MIRFKKVKYNPNTLETVLSWDVDRADGAGNPDRHSLEINEAPPPEFAAAFKALAEHVAEIVEAPWSASLVVTQVTLKYLGEDLALAAIFSAQRHLEAGDVLCFNTPPRSSEGTNEEDERVLTDDCLAAIDEVIAQARKVLDGDRAQGVLFQPANQTKAHGRFTTGPKAVEAVA